MRRSDVRARGIAWGLVAPAVGCAVTGAVVGRAAADPPRPAVVARAPAPPLPNSADLDGLYLWVGPVGAASHVDAGWDSTIGADVAVVRVREHEPVGALGIALGGSRWTELGGGRVWLDAMIGTGIGGHMLGLSAGPVLELSDVAHPRLGATVGVWGFLGVTPFVRVGGSDGRGALVEIGVHLALPAIRWRP